MDQGGRTAAVDSVNDIELYNDTLEQLKSINTQVKSPGEYVASRLESVTLDDIRRELKALLASCQSQSSGLLKSLFSNAAPFNETMESTINSILPFKDVLEDSMKQLEGARNAIKSTHRDVKIYLCRYAMVLYTKVALSTHLEANKHLDNIAEEIVDSFKVYSKEDFMKRGVTPVARAVAMIGDIAKSVAKQEDIMKSSKGKYNVLTNWSLLELVPKEINRVKGLLQQCRHHENTITRYLEEYSAILQHDHPELFKAQFQMLNDTRKTNVEKVLEIEKMLDWTDVEQFHVEYEPDKISERASQLHGSLISLTQICAYAAMKALFELYTERDKMMKDNESDKAAIENVTREINTYVSALSSLIKGGDQLYRHSNGKANNQETRLIPFISLFGKTFVKPLVNTIFNVSVQKEGGLTTASTPQEEFTTFTKFVDMAIVHLLHPKRSITMQMLNDVSKSCKNDGFKALCVFDAIAVELLDHVEKNFSSIYFAIYMDQFIRNYQAYERLLDRIELATGSYSHYLKWRGSTVPQNSSKCFSVGVVCDNFIEDITSRLTAEINAKREICGTVFSARGKEFYASSSHVLYDMVFTLLNHDNFFYHLMPQYLRGLSEMFAEYIRYLNSLVASMGCANATDPSEGESSGMSVTYATYILHDLDIIVSSLRTGTTRDLEVGIVSRPSRTRESDYGCQLIQIKSGGGGDCGTYIAECSPPPSDDSNSSTESGCTSSTNISGTISSDISSQKGNSDNQSPLSNEDASGLATTKGVASLVVDIQAKCDGEIVKMAITRLEYPLQIAFKRISHAMIKYRGQDDETATAMRYALQVLDTFWQNAVNMGRVDQQINLKSEKNDQSSKSIPHAEDIKKLVEFAKISIEKMYNFFSSAHEQLDAIKYTLEDFVIQSLFTSASCSMQFLQSMPSKFRAGNKQDASKPSNYVKYLVVPLTSFKEFTAPTLSKELSCKIMTQTVARLSAEYRAQALKLIQTVQNLNQSLLQSKNQKVKEQGANYLIADVKMIKEQLFTDITEYISQCEARLEIKYQQCEDLRRLNTCLEGVET